MSTLTTLIGMSTLTGMTATYIEMRKTHISDLEFSLKRMLEGYLDQLRAYYIPGYRKIGRRDFPLLWASIEAYELKISDCLSKAGKEIPIKVPEFKKDLEAWLRLSRELLLTIKHENLEVLPQQGVVNIFEKQFPKETS